MKRTRVWVLWAVLASAVGGALGEMPLRGQTPAQAGPAQAPAVPAGDFLKRPPVVPQAPEVERQLLLLPDGYKAELVLSDPDITDPVGVTFEGMAGCTCSRCGHTCSMPTVRTRGSR